MKLKRKSIFILIILLLCIGTYLIYNKNYYKVFYLFSKEINEDSKINSEPIIDEEKITILKSMVAYEKNPEKDKKIIEEIINYEAEENKYSLYYNLANTYYYNNDYKNCILYVDKAISFEPYCYKCYNLRGLSNKNLNNYKEAISDFTYGINIKKDSKLYFNRAILYDMILKFKNNAIADYEAAIKIDNSFKAPKLLLFNIYIYDDNIKEAKKVLENMRQTLNSKNPENYALIKIAEAIILLLENNINSSINIMNNILN